MRNSAIKSIQEPTKKTGSAKRRNGISEQISFRHSEYVKNKLLERSEEENLGIEEISRQIFNEWLKARYGVVVRENQVVE